VAKKQVINPSTSAYVSLKNVFRVMNLMNRKPAFYRKLLKQKKVMEIARKGERHKKQVMVSIVVPTYNEEKYIRECLSHMHNQDLDDFVLDLGEGAEKERGRGEKLGSPSFEIILGDGYSTDKTVQFAKKYADKIIFEEKRTIAAGRQAAAEAAKGKILVFTDADDRPDIDWLKNLLKPFSDPKIVGTYGNTIPYDGTKWDKFIAETFLDSYYKFMAFIGRPSGAGSNLAVRKDAFDKIGGFNTDLVTAEDIDLQIRLTKLGKIVYVPKAEMRVSLRRVKKWGFAKWFVYHTINTFIIHLLKKAQKEYEPVR
jgi:cellulose synthase/poly-beta-1,6-N-acetylglucosamine synthase-like glycosyltransferase